MNRFIGYLFLLLIIKTKNVDSLYAKNRSRFSNDNDENLSDELPELWITFPGFSSNVIRTVCVIIGGIIILYCCVYYICCPSCKNRKQNAKLCQQS
ncbi:unnamed protein product [Adineta steineri]|uniref:Uncharacterized protein n=1 Tax=Adineta steineri TaxID=433720 RepID=A0A820HPW8_9BILA|nr:unnamed protein product [Adineta steineri]